MSTWAPLILTLFFFILARERHRPDSDLRRPRPARSLRAAYRASESFVKHLLHGGTTATGNFNVTAALATITFGAIIVAGSKAHGVVKHWMNLVPHGLAWPIYILLIPIEIMGMFVRPFALTMRLAANMTGGHIAILAILSFVFLFADLFGSIAGVGVGLAARSSWRRRCRDSKSSSCWFRRTYSRY